MAQLNFHQNVIIFTDSIFKYIEPPYGATLSIKRGATTRTLTRLIRERSFRTYHSLTQFDLAIIHVGTNDIDNYFKRNHARNRRLASESSVAIEIFNDFMQLILEIKSQNRNIKIIISGILPRPKTFSFSTSLTIAVNNKLRVLASQRGYLHFHASYKTFMHHSIPIPELFAMDREHISRLGTVRATLMLKNLVALYEQRRLSFH